jgi:hypothetical protein
LEQQIEELLTKGLGEASEHLAELGRLGARLVLQRAVDEEVAAFLGRARYQRTPTASGSQWDTAETDPDRRRRDQHCHASGAQHR